MQLQMIRRRKLSAVTISKSVLHVSMYSLIQEVLASFQIIFAGSPSEVTFSEM